MKKVLFSFTRNWILIVVCQRNVSVHEEGLRYAYKEVCERGKFYPFTARNFWFKLTFSESIPKLFYGCIVPKVWVRRLKSIGSGERHVVVALGIGCRCDVDCFLQQRWLFKMVVRRSHSSCNSFFFACASRIWALISFARCSGEGNLLLVMPSKNNRKKIQFTTWYYYYLILPEFIWT